MAGKKAAKKKKVGRKASLGREQQKPKVTVEIQASRDELLGNYCNVAMIKHTKREFALDFLLRIDNYTILASRVITSPQHAKEIYKVLGSNIGQYEKQYGEIRFEKKKRV